MNLSQSLKAWDQKSKQQMLGVFENYKKSNQFIDDLIGHVSDLDSQVGATWLLKHALETGCVLGSMQAINLCKACNALGDWQSKLHFLQILPYFQVPLDLKYQVIDFVRKCTEADNKFVRAWGYNGLYEVANTHPEFRNGLDVIFNSASETEPASVKARLRKVQKAIAKNWI